MSPSGTASLPVRAAYELSGISDSQEERIPQDHFSRHLEAKFDLGFVRSWVQELYADRGPANGNSCSLASGC